MKAIILILSLSVMGLHSYVFAQKSIPLYPDSIPNAVNYNMHEITLFDVKGRMNGYKNVSKPMLDIYLPEREKSNGSCVIICPGGGYYVETYQAEGINIAKTFVDHGVAAFILKYRLPSDSIMKDKSIGPLQDAQQAIKLVRQHLTEWSVDPDKVGIMGFSAGGHLASTAGTHFDSSFINNKEHVNLRPDFMVLIYPVISMQNMLAHAGSRDNLLGSNPSVEKINFFSNELQVTDNTPPTWLTHTGDDKVVDVDNSINFYQALCHNKVPAEMHLYAKGGHGFVLREPAEEWMQPLFEWMKKNSWMK